MARFNPCHDRSLRITFRCAEEAVCGDVERARYIDRAIVLKPRENLPARTTDRVAQVIANVRKGAEDRNLDPDQIERIWTDLIETAIAHEAKMLGERQQ